MPAQAVRVESGPLFLLVDMMERLSSARTIEDVAAVIRSAARAICGADGVTFVARDGGRCRYVDEDAIAPLWKGKSFPLETCVSGWAMLAGKMAIIPDIYDDPRVPQETYRPTFVKSMVMTPVILAEPVAAIGAYWAEKHQPTAEELVKLELIARATATALKNAGVYAALSEAIENRDRLIAELDHRVKNVLASVMSMASQTLRSAASPEAFRQAFNGRLLSLSRAHEMLALRDWRGASVAAVVEEALRPFPAAASRFAAEGPEVMLSSEAASALLLSLHELGDNAQRYGAWSGETGTVVLDWSVDRSGDAPLFRLGWREHGGPAVSQPERRGFGSRLIEFGLARPPAGHARLTFEPSGAVFEMSAPLSDRISSDAG